MEIAHTRVGKRESSKEKALLCELMLRIKFEQIRNNAPTWVRETWERNDPRHILRVHFLVYANSLTSTFQVSNVVGARFLLSKHKCAQASFRFCVFCVHSVCTMWVYDKLERTQLLGYALVKCSTLCSCRAFETDLCICECEHYCLSELYICVCKQTKRAMDLMSVSFACNSASVRH